MKTENTVSQEIYLHLHDDEIEFSNAVFQEIYIEIIHQLNQTERINLNEFSNHQNQNIAQLTTSIIMDDENPNRQLSDWEKQNIFTNTEKDKLRKAVNDVIYNLRRVLIEKLVKEKSVAEKSYSSEEIEEIMNYNSLRIRLSDKLNRVV
jgi:DNA primase